jgi:glucokinase
LAAVDGVPAASYTAAQITDPATAATDPLCGEATAMFCAMLGTVAGNLALTLGAQGGVFIAGGIVPRLGPRFVESGFRERFEAKGRLKPYLAAIPTYVITHKLPAFLGCAAVLGELG